MKLFHLAALVCLATPALAADLRLAAPFADHMVVQAGAPVPLWGWATPGASVTATMEDGQASAVAAPDGSWRLELPVPVPTNNPFAAHTLKVRSGDETVALGDVLVGEVWLASGQSNMEFTVAGATTRDELVGLGRVEGLRMFTVAKASVKDVAPDVVGDWKVLDNDSVERFSAVAAHFGLDLLHALETPIGVIHSSWGGSKVEAWMSPESLLASPEGRKKAEDWLARQASAETDREAYSSATLTGAALDTWEDCELPVDFDALVPNMDGTIWFRRTVNLPEEWLHGAAALTLDLGAIDDADEVWLDGISIGATHDHQALRHYPIRGAAADALLDGSAVLAVRVEDTGGWGGFSSPADMIALVAADGLRLPLCEGWTWHRGVVTQSIAPNHRPSYLYNGMIAPLLGLHLAGCIWYQGESNAAEPDVYAELFPDQIVDWRVHFGARELPFYYVQLANFLGGARADWAGLREAQRRTLERLPHVGMAVTIDVGNPTDIHPRDKRTVGARLARWALSDAYGKDVVPSGPNATSARLTAAGVLVEFETWGSDLALRGSATGLGGFQVAGSNGVFAAVQATLTDGKVWLSGPGVRGAQQVRYGWQDDPADANLVNDEGLPASPFELQVE